MTDLEVVNNAKNKAILRAEKAEMQLTNAKEILRGLYFIIKSRIYYENNTEIADEMWRAEQFLKDEKPCSTTWCEDCKYGKCGLRDIGLLPKIDKEKEQ